MPHTNEAEYRAAVVAYRALHVVFYRFQKSVRDQQPFGALDPHPHSTAALVAADERDHGRMVGELLPSLNAAYRGPRVFVDRLADTLRQLGERHVAARQAPFDVHVTQQAYVDVDNILQDLLREREQYPLAFDEAFAVTEPEGVEGLTRDVAPDEKG